MRESVAFIELTFSGGFRISQAEEAPSPRQEEGTNPIIIRPKFPEKFMKTKKTRIGCVPSACCPYFPACTMGGRWLLLGGECLLLGGVAATWKGWLLSGGCLLPGGVCYPGGVSQHAMGQTPPCGWTDTCENITFANFVYGR